MENFESYLVIKNDVLETFYDYCLDSGVRHRRGYRDVIWKVYDAYEDTFSSEVENFFLNIVQLVLSAGQDEVQKLENAMRPEIVHFLEAEGSRDNLAAMGANDRDELLFDLGALGFIDESVTRSRSDDALCSESYFKSRQTVLNDMFDICRDDGVGKRSSYCALVGRLEAINNDGLRDNVFSMLSNLVLTCGLCKDIENALRERLRSSLSKMDLPTLLNSMERDEAETFHTDLRVLELL